MYMNCNIIKLNLLISTDKQQDSLLHHTSHNWDYQKILYNKKF